MKLKKIASLMLAGVMAASMLAGCQTSNNNGNNEDPDVPVVTDGVSADVEDRLAANIAPAEIPGYISFADDADLDEALTYAVQYAGVKEVANGYINFDDSLQPVWNLNIIDELEEAIGVTANDTVQAIGDNDTLVAVERAAGQAMTLPDAKAVQVYVVSGEIEDPARNEMIADAVESYVTDYQRVITNNNDWQGWDISDEFAGGNFKFSYEVSVSTCKADANSVIWSDNNGFQGVENPDVTFVAVQVVRTAEAQ